MGGAEINLLSFIFTVVGAGIAAYIGVKVAIAEIKRDVKYHGEKFEDFKDSTTEALKHHDRRIRDIETGRINK